MNILKLFCIILLSEIIIPIPIELESFSDIELTKGLSEYHYKYLKQGNTENLHYIFIKLSNYEKSELKIYLDEIEEYYYLNKKNQWIMVQIHKKGLTNVILEVNAIEKQLEMTFIDTSKILKANLAQFFNLNFTENKSIKELPLLYFNITVDTNTYFSLKKYKEIKKLNYCIIDEKVGPNWLIKYIKDENEKICQEAEDVNLIPNKRYILFIQSYKKDNLYHYQKFEIENYIEELSISKNNTFHYYDFAENNYLIFDIHNYSNVYFYINDNSGFYHNYYKKEILSQKQFECLKANIKLERDKENEKPNLITNGKINDIENLTKNDYYLSIKLNNKTKKYLGFILFFTEIHKIYEEDIVKQIDKGVNALLYIYKSYLSIGIISSSNANIKFLKSYDNYTDKIILKNIEESIIYLNSSESQTILNFNFYNDTSNEFYQYNLLMDKDINNHLTTLNNSNFFIRKNTLNEIPKFYSFYFYDLKEVYYIYIKKYFGKTNLYHLYDENKDSSIPIRNIFNPISHYDEKNYKIINNQFFNLTHYHFFTFFNNPDSLFDFYIQKANDSDYREINMDTNKYSRNLVKLLESKYYHIKFELNHLIKLDSNFLNSTVYFFKNKSTKYLLDKKDKTVYIKGNDIVVETDKIALIYFYEKIENFNDKSVIEFDKNQKGKNMKLKIFNKNKYNIKLAIAKDFGFKEYYPMINYDDLEMITIPFEYSIDLYIENYYDILETDIYESEGEKYYIYLFQIQDNNKLILLNDDNVEISTPVYFDAITKLNNKFNFNIIPKGNHNLILETTNKFNYINYQFIKCFNDFINFNVNFSNYTNNEKHIIDTNTLISKKIEKDKYNQTLIHNFESNNEFLFLYDFSNKNSSDKYDFERNENYGIKYLNLNSKNILSIGFIPVYKYYTEYFIIVAKKNEMNNLYSFSNPCYLTKLLINDSKDICYKKVYHTEKSFILEEINISKISQNESDEYIINIISNNMFQFSHFDIYNPVIYSEKNKYLNAKKLKFFDNNYLMIEKDFFLYEHKSDDKLIIDANLNVLTNKVLLILTVNNEIIKKYGCLDSAVINIEKKGKYYFEFIDLRNIRKEENEEQIFKCSVMNETIAEIDFSKNIYFGFYQKLKSENANNKEIIPYYKVSNLNEDKQVYFTLGHITSSYLYPYYNFFDFSFAICNLKNNNCVKEPISYLFLKGVEYKIYISVIFNFLSIEFLFFPMHENTTQKITESGHFYIDSPKIFIIEENKDFYFNTFNVMLFLCSSNGNMLFEEVKIRKLKINKKIVNNYYFYLEKESKYRTILFVPENNDKQKHIFITNYNNIKISNHTKISKGENCLIYFEYSDKNYYDIFTSPIDNLRFINTEENEQNKNRNTIFNNLEGNLLYIDKSDKDIYISRKSYLSEYLFFTILNDEFFESFNSLLISKNININSRLNTDQIIINDLFNIYIDKFDVKYNLYIKKYYGPAKIYESEFELNDIKNNIDILTKPINNLTNKKSAFNRLIQLNKNQLITGYLSTDSLVDIYLEIDNDNKDIYLSDFKNRKYIKKGIEYQIHFYLNHLIKLEPQFNAEVVIYNYDTKIILNNKNQTGIVIGNEFKIITNESAIIYFYPKTKKFQKRIEPKNGEIVEILFERDFNFEYWIDFGFEGYEPPDMKICSGKEIYIGNIYEKLDINLTQGEYLYIYYNALREDNITINYIHDGLFYSDYKYNLYHLRQNETKKFILKSRQSRAFILQIRQYKKKENSLYKLKLKYDNKIDEYSKKIIDSYFTYERYYKLSFETENDLILYYSDKDINYDYYAKRIRSNNNLYINDIKIINNNLIKINFNPNYNNSLTEYIIIISPEEKNKENINKNNHLNLIDLLNNKEKDFIVEEYYDIGENGYIDAIIDITKLKNNYNKFTVNIISHEFRFGKDFNFYEPKIFWIKNNYIKNICLIIGFVLFLIIIIVFLYTRKSHKKIILKKEKLKKFEDELGTELNDSKDFIENQY